MKKRRIALIVGAVLLAALALVLILRSCGPALPEPVRELLHIDPEAEDPREPVKHPGATGSIKIPGYGSITFAADQIEQNAGFQNPEQNDCYFVISLYLPDGSLIYRSGLIPPGKVIYHLKLLQSVPAGQYEDAVIHYECFRTDEEQTPLNGARAHLTLIFE